MRLILSFFFFIVLSTGLAAQPDWPQADSDLAADPAVRFGVLDNGLRYAVMPNATPKGEAALRLYIGAGSLHEAEDQRGLAHFIEHMAFNGSENVPEGELVKILERLGLAFGADTNAFTGFDQTVYQLDLPDVSEEHIDTGLMLLRETAGNLTFDPEAIDRERGVILSERRVRNTPGLRQFQTQAAFLAPGSRLSDRLPIGTEEVITNAPRQRLVDFYTAYYRPDNAALIVVGDIDADAMIAKIEARFGEWQPSGEPGPAVPDYQPRPPQSLQDVVGHFADPELTASVGLHQTKPLEDRPDTAETRKLRLLRQLGNQILARRLATLGRAEAAPFVQWLAGYDPLPETLEHAQLTLASSQETWPEALAVAEQELRRARQFGFTQAELDEQLANVETRLRTATAGQDTRPSRQLAGALVRAVHEDQVFTTPSSSLERFLAMRARLTPDAVTEAFQQTWVGGPLKLFVGLREAGPDITQQILAIAQESAQQPVTPPEAQEQILFAYTDFGAPGEVLDSRKIDDLGLTAVRFDNGVRLTVKPTDFEEGRVRAIVRFGGGQVTLDPQRPGLGLLAQTAFAAGGLEAHSQDELQRILAGRTVSDSFAIAEDAYLFSSITTPEDLDLQLQLWAAFFTAPGFRAEGFNQFQRVVAAFYDSVDATPGQVAQVILPGRLYGDARFGLPPRDSLDDLTPDALPALLAPVLKQAPIEIGIVGDIEPDDAILAVAQTFGALPARAEDNVRDDRLESIEFPKPGDLVLTHQGQADQALTALIWPTDDNADQRRTQGLALLATVFRLRLVDEIREALGASYSGQAQSLASETVPDFGFLSAGADVAADDIERVQGLIEDIAEAFAAGEITEDELERARRPILERIENARQGNGFWLQVVADAQTDPEDLDRLRRQVEIYESLTVADLSDLARTYLQPSSAVRLRIVPEAQATDAATAQE